MTEFVFRIIEPEGWTYRYAVLANEKLDAFAKVKKRFPNRDFSLIEVAGEKLEDFK